jgi:hypothetical protein
MNPRVVSCLAFSALVGFVAAAAMVAAGWGWIAGFLSYSVVGSTVMFGTALVMLPRDQAAPKTSVVRVLA